MSKPADIQTLASRLVYENRWMKVREDAIRRADGSDGIYGFVEKPDFVIILPVQDGMIHLVEQYRYPIKQRQWELPQGSWEEDPDADALALARGELLEETGLIAGAITFIGELYPLYGTATQKYRAYLATDLQAGVSAPDHEEQDLITRAFPIATVEAMILSGEIQDANTVAVFGLARLKRLL
ncbi:ADP-ribose pyrophosphatase [Xaviernesmea oryzae]|uniref:GDP-mannose pyrophosphatase n=1 Tax=Xaviernesmea oryzae TaxID=464029 RepID=A0A1Q9B1R3_9HYPH|nr:NUDIX hydrolase [Xaviernesmea oryzae]OLP61951.1 ADP-ribose pyrophosphatase [Xaviernesmea oryzae]SEK99911.1 8-oxo-dGTP pyrophosphatase MutT, NUDIX family [Xaviernesmea oryzae]